ncbi:hypothetical protein HMPREF9709_00191 [Helcococcus kunzii ATCC 51366]|uniref:ABC transporter domain-containing protein n=3 Tax=Helcococcus kunzii TaxID=40091 RepID=H3NLI0_9FIRM|nr:ABC transporter ATP-binding protein [Helcococcus kunzii]EHR35885.1 hypothetical protein HMPREF9709_00191 [Helcococcus kunzii ATCC 51366]
MERKYGLLENVIYMLKLAWERRKNKLLLAYFFIIISQISISLIELFITPKLVEMVANRRELSYIFKFTIAIIFVFLIFEITRNYCREATITRKIDVRSSILGKMIERNLTMPYELTLDTKLTQTFKKAGEYFNNNESFAEKIYDVLANFAINFILITIYIFLLLKLPIYLIIFTIISGFISFYISKKIKDWRFNNREIELEYSSKIHYTLTRAVIISPSKDIRLFGLKDWFSDIYDSVMFSYNAFLNKSAKKYIYAGIIESIFDLLRNVISYYFLINMVVSGRIDVATFILLFNAQTKFSSDINTIFESLYQIVRYSNNASVFRSFMDYENPYNLDEGIDAYKTSAEDINIELRNVSYKYPEAENYVLENINLKINPKDKIAIVGMNGSGKTTLIKIIMGFLDPTEGEVLLNGINLKEYRRNSYYKNFSGVFQDYSILPESIKVNITQNKEEVDEDKLSKVVEYAGLNEKIESLEKGIDSNLLKNVHEDGIELSGGETQKLLLARALYRDAPFLVLDEPTAALDSIAEMELYNKYNELTKDSTSIFISHRMASTRFCDYILLIKDKKILEKGTHDQLMKFGGEYRRIFDIQSKYYKEYVNEA